jgi:hypothetical protein
MVLKSVTHLLILLLLLSYLDDLQAASTPDPNDDILAAEDNEYLPVVRDARLRTELDDEASPSQGRLNATASDRSTFASRPVLLAHGSPFLTLVPDPLSVLMSFQC